MTLRLFSLSMRNVFPLESPSVKIQTVHILKFYEMDGEIMNKVLIDTLLFGKTEGLGKKNLCICD